MKKILLLLAFPIFAQDIKIPERDGYTVKELREDFSDCQVSLSRERRYEEKLIARIVELEKQVAALSKK